MPIFLHFFLSLISKELLLCHCVAQLLCSHLEHPRYFLVKNSPKDSSFLSVPTVPAENSCPGCWSFARARLSRCVFPPELENGNVTPGFLCLLGFQEEYGYSASAGLFFDVTACCYVMCSGGVDAAAGPEGVSALMLGL